MSDSDAHIQDGDILKMTKQETNEAGNKIRFVAILPSGREVQTQFFDPGVKRGKLQAWLEGVRAELVRDEEEQRARSKRAASEASLPSESAPDVGLNLPTAGAMTPPRSGTSASRAAPTMPPAPSAPLAGSPDAFVRQAKLAAEQAVEYWRVEAARAHAKWVEAQSDLEKWSKVEGAIGGMLGTNNGPSNPGAGGGAGADSSGGDDGGAADGPTEAPAGIFTFDT